MTSLKKNLVYNIMYQILILIVPFITAPYVSRVLQPKGMGTYSVTTAIAKYFVLFASLGMANYGNRTIAKVRESREKLSETFWSLYFFELVVSCIVIAFYIVYIIKFGYTKYGIISLCQIPYVISAMLEISWFFYGLEQFKGMVVRNVVIKLTATISIFCFVRSSTDLWIYVLINSLSMILGQMILWPFVMKYVDLKKTTFSKIIAHLKPNCVLFISVLAVSIFTLLDKIMVEHLSNTIEVGYYENTEKIITLSNSIVGAIGAVMLPRMANLFEKKDTNKINQYMETSFKYIMIISTALTCGIIGISKQFSIIYFGSAYGKCGTLLAVYSIGIMIYAWSNIIRTQYIIPNNQDNIFVIATTGAAVTNIILNSILIPKFGALGAVVGTIGAQITEALYQSVKVSNKLPIWKWLRSILPYCIIGCVMLFVCKMIGKIFGITIGTLCLQIIAGGCIYSVLSVVILILCKDKIIIDGINKIKNKLSLFC